MHTWLLKADVKLELFSWIWEEGVRFDCQLVHIIKNTLYNIVCS